MSPVMENGVHPLTKSRVGRETKARAIHVLHVNGYGDRGFYVVRDGSAYRLVHTRMYGNRVDHWQGTVFRFPALVIFDRGPFASMEETEAALRAWFVENPIGVAAEVFASTRLAGHESDARSALRGMAEGDHTAALALRDVLEAAGLAEEYASRLEWQLHAGLGMPPFSLYEDD